MKTLNQHNTPIDQIKRQGVERKKRRTFTLICGTILGLMTIVTARADINLGAAAPYTMLYEGSGQLSFNASSLTGKIGLEKGAFLSLKPTSSVQGNVDFAGAVNVSGGSRVTGTTTGNVSAVTDAINAINSLSASEAALSGTDLAINLPGDQTINASSGKLIGNDYVFNVTSFKFEGGKKLTINGDGSDAHNVIFNCGSLKSANFNGEIVLDGGLCSDSVLWNFSSSNTVIGLNTDLGFKGKADVTGIFLNPNGTISFGGNAQLSGRLFGGVAGDLPVIGESQIQFSECPEPSTYALLGVGLFGILLLHRRRSNVTCGDGVIENVEDAEDTERVEALEDDKDIIMVPSPVEVRRRRKLRLNQCWM